MSIAGSIIFSLILFQAIYVLVPHRRVTFRTLGRHIRNSWHGAVVSTVFMQLWLQLFPLFATLFLNNYIGQVGFVLILLLFFYLITLILLLGAEVNAFFAEGILVTKSDLSRRLVKMVTYKGKGRIHADHCSSTQLPWLNLLRRHLTIPARNPAEQAIEPLSSETQAAHQEEFIGDIQLSLQKAYPDRSRVRNRLRCKKVRLVINPRAGHNFAKISEVLALFAAAGWKTNTAVILHGWHAMKLAAWAAEGGYDLVILLLQDWVSWFCFLIWMSVLLDLSRVL